MKILVTNDDGINAPGIKALSNALASIADVIVIAPEKERSAIGHGITMHKPLRVNEVPWEKPINKGLAINGTPADCVKLGLDALLNEPPCLVISGINWGENLGTDVLYSGTVSGAIEGCINGFSSIAVSLTAKKDLDFTFAAKFTKRLAQLIINHNLPAGTMLNVNIPSIPTNEIKGVVVTRLGRRRYTNTISLRRDPRGRNYYWLAGEVENIDQAKDTDIGAINKGYISITPLQLDLTDHCFIKEIKNYLPFLWPDQENI
ncbi:MAG: 5/3-nucleotidase [Clostridia bacterium]|nr:5/3-nucleotidase [Clostridia bacterium]